MIRKRASIGRIVAQAIVFLLLCGIVGGEIPELLALTDNTANDFTVCKTKSVVSPLRRDTRRYIRLADAGPNIAAHGMLFPRLGPFEQVVLVSSQAFVLDTVLRT
jgi:hypothetical protein